MTRRKIAPLIMGLLALAALAVTPPPISAQVLEARVLGATPLNVSNASVSTDVAMLVRYIGTGTSGLVAVDAATGDLTFTDGTLGAEAATSTFECPVSGGLGGIIDVSDAACNTFGEVADIINASSNWRAVLLDVRRSDSSDTTSGVLITLAATQARRSDGLGLLLDNTTTFYATRALLPPPMRRMEWYCEDAGCSTLKAAPFANIRPYLQGGTFTSTYGSGTSAINIYSVVPTNGSPGSEIEKLEYTRAGGATTVNQEVTNFNNLPLLGPDGAKFIARITNSAAMSAVTMAGVGFALDRRLLPTPGF